MASYFGRKHEVQDDEDTEKDKTMKAHKAGLVQAWNAVCASLFDAHESSCDAAVRNAITSTRDTKNVKEIMEAFKFSTPTPKSPGSTDGVARDAGGDAASAPTMEADNSGTVPEVPPTEKVVDDTKDGVDSIADFKHAFKQLRAWVDTAKTDKYIKVHCLHELLHGRVGGCFKAVNAVMEEPGMKRKEELWILCSRLCSWVGWKAVQERIDDHRLHHFPGSPSKNQ